jgi:two-component system OmpR family response regulator
MKILLIEDNVTIAKSIITSFTGDGHEVTHAVNPSNALELAARQRHDAIILDRMLPGIADGLEILESLRARGDTTPVLILSALGDVDDRVKGLRAGGDDYLAKPFAIDELLARIESLGRRQLQPAQATNELRVGDVVLDYRTHQVTRAGHILKLRPREFRLLEYLMKHAGQVVTRSMLLENVWNYDFDPETNVIDVQINTLRKELDQPFGKPMIRTIRNVGYMLNADA